MCLQRAGKRSLGAGQSNSHEGVTDASSTSDLDSNKKDDYFDRWIQDPIDGIVSVVFPPH